MKKQQKQESKQTSFSSSEVHTGQHGLDCEEYAKYVENIMSDSDNEPDSFELESDELDAQFEDLEADQMIEERIEKELKVDSEKSVEKVEDLVDKVKSWSSGTLDEDFNTLINLERSEAHDWLRYRELEEDRVDRFSSVDEYDLSADMNLLFDNLESLLDVIMKEARNWKSLGNFIDDAKQLLEIVEFEYNGVGGDSVSFRTDREYRVQR